MNSRYVVPSFTERTSFGVKEMTPYTKLFEDRVIFLGVPIDETSANDVMAQLLTLESIDPDADINLYINSPGGEFTAMTAIYDTMQFVRPEIHTVCIGQAASAAAVLLAAGTPGKRAALPHARILLHEPHTQGGFGQSSDMEIAAREILRMRDLQEQLLARHTERPAADIRKELTRDRILTAEQARSFGVIDDVYASRKRRLARAAAAS
ncbi:ATP-dependent Clp protease proteolytic subunit [Nonomuraea soli]|uniref:ATP-dependent Clp protease proteolytic subunit n=1 Tax=Nonomuraea soli TaxID=1032476 RepID=A0A7W0CHK6_9ACTN|nr:ATP-dependent Clp protease proteolytic subunit [Nonomuraea soli]MBA2891095.1 ATP-dependent Clp protease protease subunit [Nonomuraea soli]